MKLQLVNSMKYISLTFLLLFPLAVFCQDSIKLYNPAADAVKELGIAVQSATDQNKHVLIQVGGNWCPWCIMLHQFIQENEVLDSIIKADYILLRINYSKENKNPQVLSQLEYPQRFGFPVLVILDQNGKRLHTQDTGYLEKEKTYDSDKIKRFLLGWNKAATDPKSYTPQP